MIDPPERFDLQSVLGWLVVSVATFGFSWLAYRATNRREPNHEEVQLPQPVGSTSPPLQVDLSGESSEVIRALRHVSALAESLQAENTRMDARLLEQESSIKALRNENAALVSFLLAVESGVRCGTIPPFPAIPEEILHLLE